ncbi:MAG: hypothetical protein Tsb0016_06660 [Sphingomonadales bacterium]
MGIAADPGHANAKIRARFDEPGGAIGRQGRMHKRCACALAIASETVYPPRLLNEERVR